MSSSIESSGPAPAWRRLIAALEDTAVDGTATMATHAEDGPFAQASLRTYRFNSHSNQSVPGMDVDRSAGLAWRDVSGSENRSACFLPIRQVGDGGSARVLAAEQLPLQRQVAVKVLRQDDDSARRALRHEARVAAGLEHPFVLPVHDAGQDYYVLALSESDTLGSQIGPGGSGDALAQHIDALIKVCDAVEYAHAQGIIHRDIKPDNILVAEHGDVRLVDWGLAWRFADEADPTAEQLCSGTPVYLPPETAIGRLEQIGPASDLFQLGAVLYTLLSGQAPFAADGIDAILQRAAQNKWPALRQSGQARLVAAQQQAMATDPAQRGRVSEFRDHLIAWRRNQQAEDEARRCLTEADEQFAVATAPEVQTQVAYVAFEAGMSALGRARDFWADLPDLAEAERRMVTAFVRRSIAEGDLEFARSIAEATPDRSMLQEVYEAQEQRALRRRRDHRLRLGALAALLLAVLAAWSLFAYVIGTGHREQQQRLRQAHALIDEACALAEAQPDGELDTRINLAAQAAGLLPSDQRSRAVIHDAALTTARLAMQQGDLDRAAAAINEARHWWPDSQHVADAQTRLLVAQQSDARERAALLAKRQAWLEETVLRLDQKVMAVGGLQAAQQTVIAWDGLEMQGPLGALVKHEDPYVRRFPLNIYAQRLELADPDVVALALTDGDPVVAHRAWVVAARLREERILPAMLQYLVTLQDKYLARRQAAALGTWPQLTLSQREAVLSGLAAEEQRFGLLLLNDASGFCRQVLDSQDSSGAEIEQAARVARWTLRDTALAAALAKRWLHDEPTHWLAHIIAVDLAMEEADHATAQRLMDQAVAQVPEQQQSQLLPWRIRMALDRQDRPGADALVEQWLRVEYLPGTAVAEVPMAYCLSRMNLLRDSYRCFWRYHFSVIEYLSAIKQAYKDGDDVSFVRLIQILHEQFFGPIPTGRTWRTLASKHADLARAMYDEISKWHSEHGLLLRRQAELFYHDGQFRTALDLHKQAWANNKRMLSLSHAWRYMQLARHVGTDEEITAIGEQVVQRHEAMQVIRCYALLEIGRIDDIPAILQKLSKENQAQRYIIDEILYCLPEFRRRSWPGVDDLPGRHLLEATLHLEQDDIDAESVGALLDLARKHGAQDATILQLANFLQAWYEGTDSHANLLQRLQALEEQHTAAVMQRGWLIQRLPVWRRQLQIKHKLPLMRPALSSVQYGPAARLRPVQHSVLRAETRQALQHWWQERIDDLVPISVRQSRSPREAKRLWTEQLDEAQRQLFVPEVQQ